VDTPLLLPDDYIDDIGVRLSFYKRLAGAASEGEVESIAEEMEDRFGPAPDAARTFVRAMALKPELRRLRVHGCEATRGRVTLHLADDAPIDVARLVVMVTQSRGRLKLTPDRKLTAKFDDNAEGDSLERIDAFLRELSPLAP
jgi:transcription-repair coupling factor (superfamily II helicase)